jgi:hypothetical protein
MLGRDFPLKVRKLKARTLTMIRLLVLLLMQKIGNGVKATLILEFMKMAILQTTQELKLYLALMLWAMGIWMLSLPKGIRDIMG